MENKLFSSMVLLAIRTCYTKLQDWSRRFLDVKTLQENAEEIKNYFKDAKFVIEMCESNAPLDASGFEGIDFALTRILRVFTNFIEDISLRADSRPGIALLLLQKIGHLDDTTGNDEKLIFEKLESYCTSESIVELFYVRHLLSRLLNADNSYAVDPVLFLVKFIKNGKVECVRIDDNTDIGVIFKGAKEYCLKLLRTADHSETIKSVLKVFKFFNLQEEDLKNKDLIHNIDKNNLATVLKIDNLVITESDQDFLITQFETKFPSRLYILPRDMKLYGITLNSGHIVMPRQHFEMPKEESIVLVSWILLHEFCHWQKNYLQRIPFKWKTPEFIKIAQGDVETGELLEEKCFGTAISPKRLVENKGIFSLLKDVENLNNQNWNEIRKLVLDDVDVDSDIYLSDNPKEKIISKVLRKKKSKLSQRSSDSKGYIAPFDSGNFD